MRVERWEYVLEGDVITTVSRDDPPVVGAPLTFIGRLGIPAPAEHFLFDEVEMARRRITLVRRD